MSYKCILCNEMFNCEIAIIKKGYNISNCCSKCRQQEYHNFICSECNIETKGKLKNVLNNSKCHKCMNLDLKRKDFISYIINNKQEEMFLEKI